MTPEEFNIMLAEEFLRQEIPRISDKEVARIASMCKNNGCDAVPLYYILKVGKLDS